MDQNDETASPDVSRRALLARLGGATAAAVAATTILGEGSASAAPGDFLKLGFPNDALETSTDLTSAVDNKPTLTVENLGNGVGLNGVSGSAAGVRGTTEGFGGAGVEGIGKSAGVSGTSDEGYGVTARSTADGVPSVFATHLGTGHAIYAGAESSAGLSGYSDFDCGIRGNGGAFPVSGDFVAGPHYGVGVLGEGGSTPGDDTHAGVGVGVRGVALHLGIGVEGRATSPSGGGIGLQGQGTRAPLRLVPAASAGAPSSGAHSVGEVWVDVLGRPYLCIAAGTPGRWVAPGYNSLPRPTRYLDTRAAGGPVAGGAIRTVLIHGAVVAGYTIPTAATAVVINLTVVGPAGAGYLQAFPNGPRPGSSTLNFVRGQTLANAATVGIGSLGRIAIYNGSGGAAHVLVDVSGFFV